MPLAFGTQTGGSHIRPASLNGIYGMKPSWGRVSREGVRMASPTLDTIGWYGRCVEDLSLVAEAFRIGRDPGFVSVRGLRVGVCRSPVWLHTTGEDVFNRMWTLLHAPCVGVPAGFTEAGFTEAGLPVGVTLVTGRLTDGRLLAIAGVCAEVMEREVGGEGAAVVGGVTDGVGAGFRGRVTPPRHSTRN